MDLCEARNTLRQLIFDGLVAAERRARTELGEESLYAVTLYSASGFRGLSVAVNTTELLERRREQGTQLDVGLREALPDRPDLPSSTEEPSDPDPEICAAEWEHVYSELPHERAAVLVDQLYEHFYDEDHEPALISEWFLETITAGIEEFAQALPPESGLLLGLQFGDPDPNETKLMERVSEAVNTPKWHSKLRQACRAIRAAAS